MRNPDEQERRDKLSFVDEISYNGMTPNAIRQQMKKLTDIEVIQGTTRNILPAEGIGISSERRSLAGRSD